MASSAQMSCDLAPGSEVRQTVKAHLLASQKLLVTSIYNLAPLLDCMLSAELLSQDNYHEIKAEKTPQNKARKLLEIVQAQLDENGARCFLQCLRECKQHYPRLHNWLFSDTERQLQAQFYFLCGRLGCSVLPISLALFSSSTLTQFDLERIQAAPTPTQQTQTLLNICLTKGENTCKRFYEALHHEDQQLAMDLKVTSLVEDLPSLSLNCDSKAGNVAIAVEETRDTAEGHLPYSGVLRQVRAQLGVGVGDEAMLNICELGVVVGLPRRTIRECLLEGVGIEDSSQLEALVSVFMEKTQNSDRIISRVAELDTQKVQLSKRGCLSLTLLQEAEAILRSGCHSHLHKWDHLHDQDHLHGLDQHFTACREQCMVWTVFSSLLWDCLAEALVEPELKPSSVSKGFSLAGALQCLQGCEKVEADLLQELEQCWKEGGAENLLQSIRVLAQILRDLYPFQNHFKLLGPSVEGLYTCRPCRIHRVTSFQGISARIIKKALNSVSPASKYQDLTPCAQQYRDLCLQIARLLNTVQPERCISELKDAPIAKITQHICLTLSKQAFSPKAFDVGIRHRLLALTEFVPAQLGPLLQLHQETLSDLQHYLQPGEHHNFRFDLQSIQMLGQKKLLSINRARGPVAIDNGVEEDFHFKMSEATSFLVQLRCISYEETKGYFEVSKPRCFSASRLGEDGQRAIRWIAEEVLAEEESKMWIREGGSGWREELETLARRYSIQLSDEGCLFRVTTSETECEVKFMYREGRLWATSQRDCEVL